MASVTDFLFQGKPPPSVNKYGTTTTQVPQFLSDYVQGTLNKANKLAAQKYEPYKGQRIADPNANMQAGWNQATAAATSYQPYFQSAQATLGASGAGGAAAAAQPWLGRAGSISATNAGMHSFQNAGSSFGQAQGSLGAAGGINVMGAAQPYLNAAAQSTPGMVQGYMSPYQSAVVDQIGRKGQETLQGNLHTLGDDFIKAGGLGGSRHMDVAGRAATQSAQAVTDAQAQYMDRGYQTALGAAQNDLARQAQVGQTAGQLALGQQSNMTNIGQAQTQVGQAQASMGTAQGNLALGEQQNLGNLGQMAGNFSSIDSRNMMDQSTAYMNMGKGYQQAGLTGAAATEAVGNTQRGIEQSRLDLAYNDFNAQKNHPYEMVDWMRSQTTGMPSMGGTVYENQNGPLPGATYGPSGLSQIVGGMSLAGNLGQIFKADGGRIEAPKGYVSLQDVARGVDGYTSAGGKPVAPQMRRTPVGAKKAAKRAPAAAGYTSARAA